MGPFEYWELAAYDSSKPFSQHLIGHCPGPALSMLGIRGSSNPSISVISIRAILFLRETSDFRRLKRFFVDQSARRLLRVEGRSAIFPVASMMCDLVVATVLS